jgi:nitrilase
MAMQSEPFTASVVQVSSVLFDTPRTLEKIADLTADAAKGGAKLVVFPEAMIGGYPKGLGFGTTLGIRTDEGRDLFRRYFENAIEVPGEQTETISQLAQQHGVYLVVGVIERDGGTLYCTALFFGPTGQLLGKHRKLMPTALERVVWGCGDGSTLTVLDTSLGKLGAVICWENYMPLLRTAMYAKGIELYCAPTVDDRDSWVTSMQHIACEGRCFVLSACQYLTRAQCPPEYGGVLGDDPTAMLIRGGSCIVSPFGTLLAGPVYNAEQILSAEIDPANRDVNDRDFDVALHLVFESKAAHDKYQTHPRHLKLIEENKHLWSKVRVFDSYVAK